MVSSAKGSETGLQVRFEDKAADTQEFGCMNVYCGKTSPVDDVEWYAGKYVVECPHCCQWHELRQLVTPRGVPIRFEVVRVLESE
jgi:hypothetical protein